MSNPAIDDVLLIGRISTPFGVRGELKVALISTRPDYLAKVKQVFAGPALQPYTVTRFHEHKINVYILRLQEVTTRDQAEELRSTDLYIRAKEAAPLADDEYFLHDLVGMNVRTAAAEEVGKVVELIETGANEVLVVRKIGQPDVLVPMIRRIVLKIDVPAGIIEVSALEDIIPQ